MSLGLGQSHKAAAARWVDCTAVVIAVVMTHS